jgi:hypothetical protein
MKKLFLLLVFALSVNLASAQLIRGQVLDQETKEPVDFASVFFNGTFLGTTTGENGEFELDVTPYAGRKLQISAVGYKTASLNKLKEGKLYEVLLARALYQISEVSVESKSLARKRKAYMWIFKDEFLGRTKNAGECFIMNEEDITFNYHSSRDTIRAIARKPLIILNNSLGYHITYYLDKFEYVKVNKMTSFTGNIIFNMDMAKNQESSAIYEERRAKAYTGSSKHFFTSLWQDNLSANGFSVRVKDGMQPVRYQNMVLDIGGKKYFSYRRDLEISYKHFLSTVSFRGPLVYFARDGYFEPESILWYGTMSMERIADWLPYEYPSEI